MSETYNRTLLYSGNSGAVSACTLSEPVTNFETFSIVNDNRWESYFPRVNNVTGFKAVGQPGQWSKDRYITWIKNFSVTNGSSLNTNKFQIVMQQGTNTNTRLYGTSGNSAGNLKNFVSVYGHNRLSGNETQIQGVPLTGNGWKPYNETLLYGSSAGASWNAILNLSEPASAFERIRVYAGSYGENVRVFEVKSPEDNNRYLECVSYWGANATNNYMVFSRYLWYNGTKTLSSCGGKNFNLTWNAISPYSAVATPITAISAITADGSNFIKRPIICLIGINRKV